MAASAKSSSSFSGFDGDSVIERYPFDTHCSDPASHTTRQCHRYNDDAGRPASNRFHRRPHRNTSLKGREGRQGRFERYAYSPYGQVKIYDGSWSSRSSSSYDNDVLYAGYRRDSESGLYQVRFRMLNPALGKWMQRDKPKNAYMMNLYLYAQANPALNVDPEGLFSFPSLSGLVSLRVSGVLVFPIGDGLGGIYARINVTKKHGDCGCNYSHSYTESSASIEIGVYLGIRRSSVHAISPILENLHKCPKPGHHYHIGAVVRIAIGPLVGTGVYSYPPGSWTFTGSIRWTSWWSHAASISGGGEGSVTDTTVT